VNALLKGKVHNTPTTATTATCWCWCSFELCSSFVVREGAARRGRRGKEGERESSRARGIFSWRENPGEEGPCEVGLRKFLSELQGPLLKKRLKYFLAFQLLRRRLEIKCLHHLFI